MRIEKSLKVYEVLIVNRWLNDILIAPNAPEMDIVLCFKLSRLLNDVKNNIDAYDATRKNVFIKYGEKNEETQQLSIPQENIVVFNNNMNDLLNQNVDVLVDEIFLSDLKKENLRIKGVNMTVLQKLFINDILSNEEELEKLVDMPNVDEETEEESTEPSETKEIYHHGNKEEKKDNKEEGETGENNYVNNE